MRVANLLMMFFLRGFSSCFLLICLALFHLNAAAQCINNFPYSEHFDQNNGNWTADGNASDWAWGVPKKSVIFKTTNTDKCWVVGGLTGNFYNNNENSWLKSPCFNFSGLKNPYISFLVNWDSERTYDGTSFQYSTDNGITWESAGRYGDAAKSCNDNYWFQTSSIRYGVQGEGWSGSVNNGGGKGWVMAYHSFPMLAGKSNVIFRFVFGAGSFQNNFNGFAMDDFSIGETISDYLTISYTCLNTPRQVSFTAQTNGCIASSTMQWNFDDASSGAANTANGSNVTHQFATTGSHTVTLSGRDARNEVTTITQNVFIPEVTATVKTPVLCNGGTTLAEASVTNTNDAVSYSWSTTPIISSPSAQLKAGDYTITASTVNGCFNSTSIMITEPAALQHTLQTKSADCNNQNGMIAITSNGGTAPYRYTWQGIQYTTPGANNLPAGNYSITVTDQNACVDRVDVALAKTLSTLDHSTDIISPDCGINNGSVKINTSGGDLSYTYQWMPNVSTESEANNITAGTYTVVITDIKQCRDTAFITLQSKPISVSLGKDTFICKGQTFLLNPTGDFATYKWNDGSTSPTKSVSNEGNYSVVVTNAGGCTARDTIRVSIGCGDLMFPSVFTPNGDGLNEQFGPTGGFSLVSSYRLLVYNRFGNLVFQSANPYQKWNGECGGKKTFGTYTFIATYIYDGERKMKKGTIVLFF